MFGHNFPFGFPLPEVICDPSQCLCNLILATCREALQELRVLNSAALHCPHGQ